MRGNKDAAAIARAFSKIPARVKAGVQPAIDKGASELVARMKYLAPVDPDGGGELRDSIRVTPGPQELSATVMTDNDHALFQEYGTADMDRNSFFWPSVNTLKNKIRRRIDRAISKAVKEEFTR